jgi:predicted MFS family arabinose efflux permease
MGIGGAIAFFLSWRGVFLTDAVLSAAVTVLLVVRTRSLSLPGNPRSQLVAAYRQFLPSGGAWLRIWWSWPKAPWSSRASPIWAPFLSGGHGLDSLAISLVTMAFGVAAIAVGRRSGALAGRIGRRRSVFVGLAVAGIGDGVLAVAGSDLVVAVVAIALLGGGFMLAHSTLMTLATEFAARARGTAMSLVAFCMMAGGALGSALGGRVIEATGFAPFFGLGGGLLLGLAALAAVVGSDILVAERPMPSVQTVPAVGSQ